MIIHADFSSGASGDKLLGALLDICEQTGACSLDVLEQAIDAMAPGTRLARTGVSDLGIAAIHMDVLEAPHQHHRSWADIQALIAASGITPGARDRAIRTFSLIADAEAWAHGVPVDEVHFHEVGAVDSIADVVGCCILLDALGVEEFYATPLALGFGTVQAAHGTLPVPAPATARIVTGLPVYSGSIEAELTTPTGAALVAANATSFEPLPHCTPIACGYGAGTMRFDGTANVVRVIAAEPSHGPLRIEEVTLLETNIDHISAEQAGHAVRTLMEQGALDAWQMPIMMKKDRCAVMLGALCRPSTADSLSAALHQLTGSLGIRRRDIMRSVLDREIIELDTPYGPVRFKAARLESPLVQDALPHSWVRAEADDVARISNERGIDYGPLQDELDALGTRILGETARA